jgi:aspartyl-tRNA(Asn)/glutamyl-tRNA(Gln) amidotransferase subunit A
MDLNTLTITKAHNALQTKQISSVELTKEYLKRIDTYNSEWNVYLTVTDELALKQAAAVDEKIKKGEKIKVLEGIPAAVKDIFNTKGVRTTASSKILDTYIPQYESTTTRRLFEQGMVLLGKTNCDAFAYGASTENSGYGPTKNPWNTKKVPGGSSGGSVAAVAGKIAVYALGTDTGGSIRQPAALCGVTGLKLTYGRGSRYGLIAMASSFDTPGPITQTVEDSALIAQAIAGHDPKDATTFTDPVPDYTTFLNKDIKGKKIALLSESFKEGVESGVKDSVKIAVKKTRRDDLLLF